MAISKNPHILNASDTDAIRGGANFPLRHRVFRALWNISWLVLAAWTPPPLHSWRRFLLRAFGAKVGKGVRVYGSARVWYPPNLEMHDYSVMGWKVNCYNQDKIVIGAYAIISQYSHLVTGSHDFDSPAFQLFTKPIWVGRRAWIASDSFVGPGVAVGDGAVLGARSVTFKDLDAWTVYVGNPVKAVRKRAPIFDES